VILDACRTGKLMDGELNKTWGNIIKILSCSAKQKSVEDPIWQHGAFTYCLINGLTGSADFDTNKLITKNEITIFLKYHLPIITKKTQNPEISGGDDNYILSYIKSDETSLTLNWTSEEIDFKNPGFKEKTAFVNIDSALSIQFNLINKYIY
jgi:uncharacterized caspase-like protein